MPGGDRTGPMGRGPMTGRGAGYCAGFGMPGYMNFGPGRGFRVGRGWGGGFGMGFRGGRGRRSMFYGGGFQVDPIAGGVYSPPYGYAAPAAARDELADLKNQAGYLSDLLKDINRRIDELQSAKEG